MKIKMAGCSWCGYLNRDHSRSCPRNAEPGSIELTAWWRGQRDGRVGLEMQEHGRVYRLGWLRGLASAEDRELKILLKLGLSNVYSVGDVGLGNSTRQDG